MGTRQKILIVDDNAANLTTCKTILKDSYDVYTATSAASMMSLLKNILPDIIMLDIKMPDINGYDAARLLKSNAHYKDIPIIFVSALSDVESEMEGLELGAVDYISKPYFPPILIRRIKTQLELTEKTKKLEMASQAKTNFLANMSHEMRTPLTAVLGLTELMLNTSKYDEETASNLMKIYRAGETLLSLINDILDISKIEVDRLTLNPADYNVADMLSDTIAQSLQYITKSESVDFKLNVTGDLPKQLNGDELRVKQILNNLLSNAFKFTQKGTVELDLECEKDNDNTVWFTARVCDTGTGIHAEDIGKLFTTYPKMEEDVVKRSTNRRTQGTGLGLYISKRIADMMGGTITVESTYGKGSCFTVKVKQKFVSDDVIDKETLENLGEMFFNTKIPGSVENPRLNMSYARVLVVDDTLTNLDVAKGMIGLYGIKVDCMNNAKQAIDAIRNGETGYNAIFIDHLMPEMDGLEAARIIREEIDMPYAKTVPLIALTANAITGNEEIFLSKGFQAFIPKPIELSRLDSVLRQWVRDADAEARLENKTIYTNRYPAKTVLLKTGIPGLDTQRGTARYGGSEVTYIDILRSYAENTKTLLKDIENIDSENLDRYATIIHGIKGSSYGICAETAGDEAQALEDAAAAGDIDYITENNPKLINTVTRLISEIENACKGLSGVPKPSKKFPDAELIKGMQNAVNDMDIDAMDAAIDEIDKWDYTDDDGLCKWLRKNLILGKYDEIKEKLNQVIADM